MKTVVDNLISKSGWSGSGATVTFPAENEIQEFIAGLNSKSLIIKFAAGSNGEYAQKTMQLAVEQNISIYDAAYVSLTDFMGIIAYSADKKLVNTVQKDYGKAFLFITLLE